MKRIYALQTRSEAIQRVVANLERNEPSSSTGFPKLDEAMGGGLYPGKAYGIQARKKIGKTVLMGSISYALNEQCIPHLWLAAEMNAMELEQRQQARELKVDSTRFLQHDPGLAQEVSLGAIEAGNSIYYADVGGASVQELDELVRRAHTDHGIRGVFLDYLQLVRGKETGNRTEHLEYVAQWISTLVRELGIWAVVAAQLNQEDNTRGGEGMLLAFDMVFTLKRDKFKSDAWLEMVESRYTPYTNIGSSEHAGYKMITNGPYFEER